MELEAWTERMKLLVERFESTFEQINGYEAEGNLVEPMSTGAPATPDGLPDDLIKLYQAVREVRLPDLENGYFIHPIEFILNARANGTPMHSSEISDGQIYVFGSNGGGDLFAVPFTGAPVYLLPPGRVHSNVYRSTAMFPQKISNDIESFLLLLESKLERAIEDH
ncbi:hypothetical protein AB0G02_17345 [Actinosynnema sp. NPDC023658]|uniref:hypothetical protein n=1 Tax=Actinosynnema sp. NPDC023658 TaxID=3155465 RepID=UPI0033C47112